MQKKNIYAMEVKDHNDQINCITVAAADIREQT
jgi:hypothetical protein